MAEKYVVGSQSTIITESDIDGASLNGRHPKQLTIQQLKFWLACRRVTNKKLKTKAEMIAR